MIILESPKGLGDALYVRAIALYLQRFAEVRVRSLWPEVFSDMRIAVEMANNREWIEGRTTEVRHVVAGYHWRIRSLLAISHFSLACAVAGFEDDPIKLDLQWRSAASSDLLARIRNAAAGRPVLVYQSVKRCYDAEQRDLHPRREAFNRLLQHHAPTHFRVRLGHANSVDNDPEAPRELDLFGETSVREALNVVSAADLVLAASPSYMTIAAEGMNRKLIALFSARARTSRFIRAQNWTPERALHTPTATVLYDD